MERYYSLTEYFQNTYGRKLYKLALDGGMTCPNRDGSIASGGCIFCSGGGSGDFACNVAGSFDRTPQMLSVSPVFDLSSLPLPTGAKDCIAYLQAYTNTYAPLPYLEALYRSLLSDDRFAGLSIATRPDCLPDEVLTLLARLKKEWPSKFIWVELGFQTAHKETALFIRRGYDNAVFADAVRRLDAACIPVIAHLILGLPYPAKENSNVPKLLSLEDSVKHEETLRLEGISEYEETISYVNSLPVFGVKLQLLHVLKNTALADYYMSGAFPVLTEEEYVKDVCFWLARLRKDIVIHRITGDGPKDLLIAPKWSGQKHHVLNAIRHAMKEQKITQGIHVLLPDENRYYEMFTEIL